jgi:hypothetical protein
VPAIHDAYGHAVTPTVFVGVYGSLQPHSWIEVETMPEDLYSLFNSRATAMGWSSSGRDDSIGVPLWGMNEAELNVATGSPQGQVAWFQVGISDGFRPLPVVPLLACVDDALRRVGELHLDALQLSLPLRDSGYALSNLVSSLNWFAICDAAAKTSVRVTIDGGDGSAIDRRASEILATLQRTNTEAFDFDSVSIDDSMAVDPIPPVVVDDPWFVPSHPRVTLVATAPEWSVDALAWIVALVAEVCRASEASPTIMISIARN